MTDSDLEAEAVIGGLANRVTCECGLQHDHAPWNREYNEYKNQPWRGPRVVCAGCNQTKKRRWEVTHGMSDIRCICGCSWGYGPRAGWRVVIRSAKNYKRVIAEQRERIAYLEERLESIG